MAVGLGVSVGDLVCVAVDVAGTKVAVLVRIGAVVLEELATCIVAVASGVGVGVAVFSSSTSV